MSDIWEDDYEYEPDDSPNDCDHVEADVDILTGILSCACGYSTWLTTEELRREIALQAEMYEAYAAEITKGERA